MQGWPRQTTERAGAELASLIVVERAGDQHTADRRRLQKSTVQLTKELNTSGKIS
jgi:hypothetical protein